MAFPWTFGLVTVHSNSSGKILFLRQFIKDIGLSYSFISRNTLGCVTCWVEVLLVGLKFPLLNIHIYSTSPEKKRRY